jgi:hypothetical protein
MTRCSAGRGRTRLGRVLVPRRLGARVGENRLRNNWVVLAVRVRLPMISRPVALPVMAKLVIKGTASASRLWLARRVAACLARELPGRKLHVTADSAYAGKELKQLPDGVTWTTRLRVNAALHDLPPARTGRKGRPRH